MEALERAIQELNEQNYGSAIRALELITARDPINADAWKHLTQAYLRTGDQVKAAEAAQRYASLRPTDAEGHYVAGTLLAEIGQQEAAARAFRVALSVDPGHAEARRALVRLEGIDEETGQRLMPGPRPSVSTPAEDVRRRMPWQAKVAAALTVVASLAIILWLFLPGGRARPGPPTARPEPNPSAITTPPPQQPLTEQATSQLAPGPDQQPELQPPPNATAPVPSAPEAANQPFPNATQPSLRSPGSMVAPRSLFTPEQARQAAEQIDQAYQRDVALAKAQIGQIAQAIRNLDEETWREGGRDAITLLTTQVLGTNVSPGTLAALQMVSTAETPAQAADRLEAYARTLPPALSPQQLLVIQQVLSRPDIKPEEAYRAIKDNFDRWGIGLLDGPRRALDQLLRGATGLGGTVP